LEEKLRELDVSEVFVVGLALDYCVGSTALDAKRLGFDVTIVK
jgi:nicotinamidase-related amidase